MRVRVGRLLVALVVVCGGSWTILAGPASAASLDTAAYTGERGGPGHAGYNSSALPPAPVERWSRTFEGSVSSPIVSDGRVLFTAQRPNSNVSPEPGWGPEVVALSAVDGRPLWPSIPLAEGVQSMAYDDGRLVLVLRSGLVEAVDVALGTVTWVRPGAGNARAHVSAADGTAILSSDDSGKISAIRIADGAPLWSTFVPKYAEAGPPSYFAGHLVLEDGCGAVYLMDAATGAVESGPDRTVGCEDLGLTVPVPVQGDRAFTSTRAGAEIRSLPDLTVQGTVSVRPTSVDGNRVFGVPDGHAVAVDLQDNRLWTSAAADYLQATTAVPGLLAVRSNQGRVDLLSQITGQRVFTTGRDDLTWDQASTPIAVGDGLLLDPHGNSLTAYGDLSVSLPVLPPLVPPLPVYSPPVPASPTGTSWTGYGGNGRHDGNQPAETVRPPLTRAWAADLPGGTRGTPLVIPGAVVVLAPAPEGEDVDVHAYSPQTGAPLWPPVRVPGIYTHGGMTYSAGVLVVSTGPYEHTAGIDAATGKVLWEHASAGFADQPVAVGGKFCQASFVGNVFTGRMTNLGTGNTLPVVDGRTAWTIQCCWRFDRYDDDIHTSVSNYGGLSGGTSALPSLQNGQVNVVSGAHNSNENFSFDPVTGGIVDALPGHVPAAADGNVVITPYFTDVVASEARTHRVLWRTTLARPLADQPIIAGGRTVFVRQITGEVDALDALTGAVLWSDPTAGSSGWSTDSSYPGGMALGQGVLVVPTPTGITVYRGVGGVTFPGAPTTATDFLPAAPAAPIVLPGDGGVTVSWAPPASSQAPVTGYDVFVAGSDVPVAHAGPIATSVEVGGLTNGQAYSFTVAASNDLGRGPASAASAPAVPVKPSTPPSAPATVTATAAAGSATVSWTRPTSDGGSPITSYTVTGTPGGRSVTVAGTATNAQITGLTNGTAYTFTVRATNAKGSSPESAASTPVTPRAATTVPAAPGPPTAVPGDRAVQLSWVAPSDGGSPITGYVVTPILKGVAQPARTYPSTATTQTVSGLVNGTAYTFTVAALNAKGRGPASPTSAAATPAVTAITGAGTRATVYGATVTVAGTAPSGALVGVWFRASNESSFVQRRSLRASASGTWSTTYVAAQDERIYVTSASVQSAQVLIRVEPTISGAATRTVPRGTNYTVSGTGSPGSTVTLHMHRVGTASTDYSTLLSAVVGSNGTWTRTYKATVDYRFYATLPNGLSSPTVLVQAR